MVSLQLAPPPSQSFLRLWSSARPGSSVDLYSGQLKAQCAINRDKGLGSMKFLGNTTNTVVMACFITMINLHSTSLAPATANPYKNVLQDLA